MSGESGDLCGCDQPIDVDVNLNTQLYPLSNHTKFCRLGLEGGSGGYDRNLFFSARAVTSDDTEG